MNEELLKVIVQLFAIVAKERVTDDEKDNLREFLSIHVSHDTIPVFISLFEKHLEQSIENKLGLEDVSDDTIEYVDDWSNIMFMCKQINEGLTRQQKIVLLLKLIEMMLQDGSISERQSNLIFYIGEVIKIKQKEIDNITKFLTAQDIDEIDSRDFLVVDEGSVPHEFKSKHIIRPKITGIIAFLRIQDADTYFVKYLGISALVLNELNLRSRKVFVFPTGSTIRGSKMQPVYYSEVVAKFRFGEVSTNISFEARQITYKFKSGDVGLRQITIAEEGGKLIGLMGASGSGKSTLLNVLNGSERPASGQVIINGIDVYEKPDWLEGVVGFVPQDDFLIEELTVYENLYYAARLCFGHLSEKQTSQLVAKTLKNLGLTETKALRVGSILDKTISGGQRKRLNIGLELLRAPSVLFIDEPTSGLSSRDSVNIMDLLKELTLNGKMVFVVIHQPSSDIFKMFDSLLILDVGGYQVYYGNPVEALIYFKSIVNMVNKEQGACIECGNVNAEQIFNIIEARIVNEYGRYTDRRKILPKHWHKYFMKQIEIPKIAESSDKIKVAQKIPGLAKQLKIFSIRDIRTKMMNKQYLFITFLEAPVLALFLSYMIKYYSTVDQQKAYIFSKNENIPIFFFMAVIVALFMGLTLSAEEIIKDRKNLKRESFLHLSRLSYITSKITILFGISAIQTFTFVILGNTILGITGMTASTWLMLFAVSCFANMLGLNISSAFKTAVTVYVLIPILLIPQLVLSGVIINFDNFNYRMTAADKIPMIGDLMASRWGFEALNVKQFKDNDYQSLFFDVDRKISLSAYKKTYYLSRLEGHLAKVSNNWSAPSFRSDKSVVSSLLILRNSIGKELQVIGRKHFPTYTNLEPDKVDTAVINDASVFLSALKAYYSKKHNKALQDKQHLLKKLSQNGNKTDSLNRLREDHYNEAVAAMVENDESLERITDDGSELIMKIYPIYYEPNTSKLFDYRSKFYASEKAFLGVVFDTFYFNMIVIWMMSVFLMIALYYEWLKRIIDYLGSFRDTRRYRRQRKSK